MAEDSLLLARLTRGIVRYIWKLKVDSQNQEAVGELIDQYAQVLKRARALDTSASSPNYDSKSNPMSVIEDLFIPVWGDCGDLTVEEVGGKADIRWIVDIEELRNQLACAVRCPLSLLGGWVKDATGALGSESIEKLDVRFARSSRRLQRALKNGITRLCQIHLAYQNMDPDSALFEVNMSETSSAEEEALKDALDTGVDVVQKILDMLEGVENIDKVEVINYLNQKILKLEDFELDNFMKAVGIEESLIVKDRKRRNKNRIIPVYNKDVLSYLPHMMGEKNGRQYGSHFALEHHRGIWEKKYGRCMVGTEVMDETGQGRFDWKE